MRDTRQHRDLYSLLMSIPDISIPKIDIPNIPVQVIPPISVFNDYVTNPALKEPSLMLPGCYKTHRDADKNSNLINDDPTGAFGVVLGEKFLRLHLLNLIDQR